MRKLLLVLLVALVVPAAAHARYLHAADAIRVVAHEQQRDQRAGLLGGYTIVQAGRYNAHGVNVWVRTTDVAGAGGDRYGEVLWLEHVRLFPDGTVTCHMDGYNYRYRETLYSGSARKRGV